MRFKSLGISLLLLCGCANTASTLGSIHDFMLSNPHYSLKMFIGALEQYQPEVILSEVRPENYSVEDAAIEGGIEQTVVYAYANEHSIPVIGTDWFNDDLIAELDDEEKNVPPQQLKKLEEQGEFRKAFSTESLVNLNSPSTQDRMRQLYALYEKNGLMASRKRNDRICENIKAELSKIKSRRVLIVFGLDHKFFIDDCLLRLPRVQVLPVADWFRPESFGSFEVSDPLKKGILQNLTKTGALLEKRLNSNFYSKAFEPRLKRKLTRFGSWVTTVSDL